MRTSGEQGVVVVTGREKGEERSLMQCEVRHEPPCDQGSAWLQVAGMLLPLVEPAGVPTVQGVPEAGVDAAAVHGEAHPALRAPILPRTSRPAGGGTAAASTLGRDAVATKARGHNRQAATL